MIPPGPESAGYVITTDTSRFDIAAIHAFLSESYWSPGVPRAIVERAIANPNPYHSPN